MSNFLPPFFQAFDTNGDPVPGAKLYTYQAGSTSTNQATYSAATMAPGEINANPIVADANGVFGRIFCDPSLRYKFVLKTSAGVTLWTADYVDSAFLNSSSIAERIEQIASNPMDNGAVGNGVADDSAAVQDAIDNATGVVDLLGKTYRCDSLLSLNSNITLRNGTLDFTNSSDPYFVAIMGTRDLKTSLTGAVSAGDATIAVASVDGISTGDLLWIDADEEGGEIVEVASVATPNISLTSQLVGSYSGGNVSLLTAKTGVLIDSVKFIASSSGSSSVVYVSNADRVTVRNCQFAGVAGSAVAAEYARNVIVDGCNVSSGGANSVGLAVGNYAQGVSCQMSTFVSLKHGISVFGLSAFKTIVNGCKFANCSDAGVNLPNNSLAKYVSVSGCVFDQLSGSSGVYAEGLTDVRVYGCSFIGGDYGIHDVTVTGLSTISNYFTGQGTAPIAGVSAVIGFTATGTDQDAIEVVANGTGTAVKGTGGGTAGTGGSFVGGAGGGTGCLGTGGGNSSAGVKGIAGGSGGYGVYGESTTGTAGYFISTAQYAGQFIGDTSSPSYAPIHLEPSNVVPTYGVVGDLCVVGGILYICTTASNPGPVAWTKVGLQS